MHDLVSSTEVIGKGIILFVGFYTGLQWLYYRDIRERAEAAAKERDAAAAAKSKPAPKPKPKPVSEERSQDM